MAGGADGAIPVAPIPDTVKRVRAWSVVGTIDREPRSVWRRHRKPSGSRAQRAHERAAAAGQDVTDDAMLLEDSAVIVASRATPGT